MPREEATTIRVNAALEDGILVLSPLEETSRTLLQEVLNGGNERSLWHFGGSRYDDPFLKKRLLGVCYHAGGTKVSRTRGNVSYTTYENSIYMFFEVSETSDAKALYALRNMGYYTGGLTVAPESTAEQMRLRPKKNCERCGGPLKSYVELEWKVCDSCAAICDHDYRMGIGQSKGALAYLSFCHDCGRGDPAWEASENPLDDMFRTVTEGGLAVLVLRHEDGSTTTVTKK